MNQEKKPKTKVVQTGFPICAAMFFTLLVLKLAHVIDIGWGWVFAPFWIPVAVVVAIIAIYFVVIGIIALIAGIATLIEWIKGKVGR